jgi:Cep192 domain 4/Abnormal spindle-like microcephaly-assoc'd, ASPM-SPD-2-Hydin
VRRSLMDLGTAGIQGEAIRVTVTRVTHSVAAISPAAQRYSFSRACPCSKGRFFLSEQSCPFETCPTALSARIISSVFTWQFCKATARNRGSEVSSVLNIQLFRRLLAAAFMSLLVMAMAACQGVGSAQTNNSGNGGGAGQLTSSSSSVSFGNVQVGSKQSQSVTLANSGTTSITVSAATVSGSGFSLGSVSLPLTVAAGQKQTVSMSFAPQAAGAANGTLAVTSNASNGTIDVALSGTGTANTVSSQLSVSPASINFGNVAVGSVQDQIGTLSASGASVTVSSAAWNGQGYSVSGITFPVSVAAGNSISYTVSFTPQAAGSTPGSISFVSDASNSPSTQTLTGSGTQASSHTVALSWTASTSTVAGYNVYRGTQSGGPYAKLNSSLLASTNYTDAGVVSGTTYYYVATAVDSSNVESAYSTPATAAIP